MMFHFEVLTTVSAFDQLTTFENQERRFIGASHSEQLMVTETEKLAFHIVVSSTCSNSARIASARSRTTATSSVAPSKSV